MFDKQQPRTQIRASGCLHLDWLLACCWWLPGLLTCLTHPLACVTVSCPLGCPRLTGPSCAFRKCTCCQLLPVLTDRGRPFQTACPGCPSVPRNEPESQRWLPARGLRGRVDLRLVRVEEAAALSSRDCGVVDLHCGIFTVWE